MSLPALFEELALAPREPAALSSLARDLADRLLALDPRLDAASDAPGPILPGGQTPAALARALLDAIDPASISAAAALLAANESGCACSGDEPPEPSPAQIESAAELLARASLAPLANNPALRAALLALDRAAALPAGPTGPHA